MALCDCCNVTSASFGASKRKRNSNMLIGHNCFTMCPNREDAGDAKKARVLSRSRVNRPSSLYETFEKDLRAQPAPIFDYEQFRHVLFATTVAAATMAYHQQQCTDMCSYYQVLPDMRVVKYVFDPQETMRLACTVPVWCSTIVGEYVFFPSEGQWIFVNAVADEPPEMIEHDAPTNRSFASMREMHPTPGTSQSMPPPPVVKRVVPKLRYCAHRSHTPSSNFAEVVHREPIRENWHLLINKLLALKREIDSKKNRRCRPALDYRSWSYK